MVSRQFSSSHPVIDSEKESTFATETSMVGTKRLMVPLQKNAQTFINAIDTTRLAEILAHTAAHNDPTLSHIFGYFDRKSNFQTTKQSVGMNYQITNT